MELMAMSFRDFVWEVNPTALEVTQERTVPETVLPFAGSRVTDLGPRKRRVTGEGYFTGPGCREQFGRLEALYRAGGPGSLCLPGQEPFLAVMDGLRLLGAAGKDLIRYGFSFVETRCRAPGDGGGKARAQAGESLWDYAARWGRSIDELTRANPQIEDIACLQAGEEVTAP